MPGIGNNLYPPIVSTWMPAFIRSTPCNIYFSLSIYNNISDIVNAQVIVNNQSDNRSALDGSKYPTGIKICNIETDTSRTDDKYYIKIEPNDLTNRAFGLNQFYKVQIRFTGTGATSAPTNRQIASWLTTNQEYFSEWSTVCLIKGIEKPSIYLKGFEEDNSHQEYELTFSQEIIDLVGHMYYESNGNLEKETLKSYNVTLYNLDTNTIIYSSDDIYTNIFNPNEINHTLKVRLENGLKYKLILNYTTTNEYTDSVSYVFNIIQNSIEALAATIKATPDIEYGSIKIEIESTTQEAFFGNLTIRRTSSKSNYKVWEDVHQEPIANGKPLNYIWNDYTVESGVWYKYGAQKRNSRGDRGLLIIIKNPVMVNLDDMFLTRANMQFRIRFDPTVSNFRYNYSEAKIDTLGSQYPYFRRNGNVKYRQLSIGGLITAWCDDQGIFLNKDNIYKESKDNYIAYNKDKNITDYNDYIYERAFREKIMDFLYADDVKLFRSTTEGNILVRLMDISFTPNDTLGRMLYSFTATAYEIDDCNLDNLKKYGIQIIDNYSTNLIYDYSKIGQFNGILSGANDDLFIRLREKYEHDSITNSSITKVSKLKWLRIECQSNPYIIEDVDGTLTKATLTKEHGFNEDMAEGYIAYINKQPIIISPRGYIEFSDSDTEITSVYFPYSTDVILDYLVELRQSENLSTIYNKIFFYTKVGQLHDAFMPLDNIFKKIYTKYLLDYSKYRQELISIDKLIIEAEPGTVIYVKDSFDNNYFRHEIGKTGVLEFYDDEAVIMGFYFSGIYLPSDHYSETGIEVEDSTEIINPIEHCVYRIKGERMIYYNNQFYNFNKNNEIQCPIEATVDYICEYMRGEY